MLVDLFTNEPSGDEPEEPEGEAWCLSPPSPSPSGAQGRAAASTGFLAAGQLTKYGQPLAGFLL